MKAFAAVGRGFPIYYHEQQGAPSELKWKKAAASADAKALYPRGAKGALFFELKCQLRDDGALAACVPRGHDAYRFRALGKRISRLFQADTSAIPGGARGVRFVVLSVLLSDGSASGNACQAPFCVPTPPPPPPPKSHGSA